MTKGRDGKECFIKVSWLTTNIMKGGDAYKAIRTRIKETSKA